MDIIEKLKQQIPVAGEESLSYHEAIDGGVNYGRPSSGFSVHYFDGLWRLEFVNSFDTGDGWDSFEENLGEFPDEKSAWEYALAEYNTWKI
jgi:hypothetical protein